MLLKFIDIIDILQCPKFKYPLELDLMNKCLKSKNTLYDIIEDLPILINFEESICNKDSYHINEAKSVVGRVNYRSNVLLSCFKGLVAPTPNVTKSNISTLINFLALKKTDCYKPKLLIIGGGSVGRGTDALYKNNSFDIISFDVYKSDFITFIADGHEIPLKDDTVDAVLVQYVIEHVVNPQNVINDAYRVLKSNGMIYSETPFLEQVHESAYDFTRFTHSGHRFLFRNFKEVKSGIVCGVGIHLLWTIEYIFRGLFRSKKVGKVFKLLFFWVQYIDLFIKEAYIIDMADSFYFLGQKTNEKFTVKDLTSYYIGKDNR